MILSNYGQIYIIAKTSERQFGGFTERISRFEELGGADETEGTRATERTQQSGMYSQTEN